MLYTNRVVSPAVRVLFHPLQLRSYWLSNYSKGRVVNLAVLLYWMLPNALFVFVCSCVCKREKCFGSLCMMCVNVSVSFCVRFIKGKKL